MIVLKCDRANCFFGEKCLGHGQTLHGGALQASLLLILGLVVVVVNIVGVCEGDVLDPHGEVDVGRNAHCDWIDGVLVRALAGEYCGVMVFLSTLPEHAWR